MYVCAYMGVCVSSCFLGFAWCVCVGGGGVRAHVRARAHLGMSQINAG